MDGECRPMVSKPNPIDVHVGKRLRLRRTLLGMSQERLGELLSLTFQQIQKYERGVNRIGSSRLYELGQILDVPVSFFFDEMVDVALAQKSQAGALGLDDNADRSRQDQRGEVPLESRETLELIKAYYRINDAQVRKRLFELAKALGSGDVLATTSQE